jgi:hypothetical protein
MAYLILAGLSTIITVIYVNKNIARLWKTSAIGVGIMLFVDSLGTKLSYYNYTEGIIYLGSIPVFHIIYTYIMSMLFLNWLPPHWAKRVLYIIYISVLFLVVETVMFSAGAIVYIKWKIWYSYFLLVGGLLLLAFLSQYGTGERETIL